MTFKQVLLYFLTVINFVNSKVKSNNKIFIYSRETLFLSSIQLLLGDKKASFLKFKRNKIEHGKAE